MADKIIAATLQVDVGSSNANIQGVNKSLNEVKGNLKETGTAAAKTGKDVDTSTGSFKNLKGQIGDLPGPLGQASAGVNKLSGTFKALLANPVVLVIAAIVAGLALLYKAFTNTFAGGQKMEQIFAGIKAAGQALIDNLTKVASAIVKVFKFDFSGAIDDIKGVAKAAGDAFNAMAKLTAEAQNLAREQATNDLDQAKRARDLALLREQATDEDVPLAKRKAALKELQVQAQVNAKEDIDLAKRTADNKIAQLTLEKDGEKKNFAEIQKIKADQVNVETQNANELRRINKQVTSAEKQEQSERAEAAKAAVEAAKQNRQKNFEANNTLRKLEQENILLGIKDAHEKELKQLEFKIAEEKRINQRALNDRKVTQEQARQIEAALTTQFILEQNNLIAKHNEEVAKAEAEKKQKDIDEKLKLDEQNAAKAKEILDGFAAAEKQHTKQLEEEAQARIEIANLEAENRVRTFDIIGQGLSVLGGLIGKSTALGKATAVAETIINTYTAAWQAFRNAQKNPASIPFPAYPYIQAGIAIVAGLATVRSILAVKTPGGSAGGGTPTAPTPATPAAPIAPTVSTTALDQDTINRQGNAANPARVYMVEQDGANTAERISRLNRASRLGG